MSGGRGGLETRDERPGFVDAVERDPALDQVGQDRQVTGLPNAAGVELGLRLREEAVGAGRVAAGELEQTEEPAEARRGDVLVVPLRPGERRFGDRLRFLDPAGAGGGGVERVAEGGSVLPATGQAIRVEGMNFYRLRDGRVTDIWTQFDGVGLMQQLGAIPT